MFNCLCGMLFLTLSFCQSAQASLFEEWHHINAKDYAKSLASVASKTKKELKKEVILARIREAKSQEKWEVAVAELEILIGQDPKDIQLWLDLALVAHRGATASGHGSYELSSKSEKASIYVYDHSSDKTQQALALLIYAANPRSSDAIGNLLTVIEKLVDIKILRKDNPEYADLLPFVYREFTVERDGKTPQVCFSFSHPLAEKFKPADYFEITPKIDGSFKVRDSKICLSGIQFSENYKVSIKEGIPSLFGEKTVVTSNFNFLVDDKEPRLSFPTQTYILQKGDEQVIPLTAVNVKRVEVQVVRVNDRSFVEGFGRPYRGLNDEVSSYEWKDISNRYGEPLFKGSMEIGGEPNKSITKQMSLSQMVKDLKPGAYGIFVKDSRGTGSSLSASQWVLITDIGMTVFKGTTGLDVNVRSLGTAKSLNKIELKLISYNNQILDTQKTNAQGFAHFDPELLRGKGGNRPAFIFAYGGIGNFAALKLSEPEFDLSDRGVGGRKVPGNLDAFLYTERGVYRPGESVRVNTILRTASAMEVGGTPLTFQFIRPDDVVAQTQTLTGSPHGLYELMFPLSTSSRTGVWSVKVFMDPKAVPIGHVKFSVEDFVPTRLLVTLKSLDPFLVLGKPLTLDVLGRFLFGSPASGLAGDASLVIRHHPNPFPKHPGYQFGLLDDKFVPTRSSLELPDLDAEGNAKLVVTADTKIESTLPLQAIIQASVRDGGGRPQSGTVLVDVQTYPYMIGLRGDFKNGAIDFQETTASIDVITLNLQGEQIGALNLRYSLYQEELFYNWSKSERGHWEYKSMREDTLVKEGELSTTKEAITKLTLPIGEWGYYRLVVKDPKTGATSSFRFTKGHLSSDAKTMTPDKLTVIQDKSAYTIGETIKLHIQSPFDGEALLVVANQGVLETRNFKVLKSGTDITLKASEAWGTGAYVLISAFRPLKVQGKDLLQNSLTPKRAVGLSWVALSREPRTLKVTMTPPKEVKPCQKIVLPVHVEGDLKSETFVTLAAVDEGILFLTDFQTPKPQDYFYGKRTLGVEMRDLYGKIMDPMPGEMGELRSGGDEGVLGRNLAALSKRSFRIVSLFQGPINLDANGKAMIPLDLPDFNGTLRLMLVASNKNSVGSGESSLLVRDPVVSEPVFPRFLSVGDTSQMSLSLFNPSQTHRVVKVSILGQGALGLKEQSLTATLEKEGKWHTNVPLHGKTIGDGTVVLTLTGEGFEPITRKFDLTVRPATPPTNLKSTILLQPGETKTLDLKGCTTFLPTTTSLDVTASSHIPWNLSSFLKNLMKYPYGCVEQTVSRGFAILYKKDQKILSDKETVKDLDKALFSVLAILAEKQDREGGFPLWSIYSASDAWLTAYAYDFMSQIKVLGVKVPENTYEMASNWLRSFVKSRTSDSSPLEMGAACYAISLLAGEGIIEDGACRHFFDTYFEKLTDPLSRAQLGLAIAKIGDMGRAKLAFRGLDSGENKDPTTLPYGSLIRNKAALIKTLIETLTIAPTLTSLGDLAEAQIKIVAQHILPTHILSTQEQAWLLRAALALTKSTDDQGPGNIKLGVNEQVLEGDRFASQTLKEDVITKGVVLINKGKSPLWINTVLYGFPKDPPKEIEKGLKIQRKYYTTTGEEVNLHGKKDLMQGDQFVVVIKGELLQKPSAEIINHMLAVDWLPAGFEIDMEKLVVSPVVEEDKDQKANRKLPWDELSKTLTTEARDDRFIAALELSNETKSFTLAYRVRAITPGTYHVPGLHVEDMFMPSIYANTLSGLIEIKGRD